MPVKEGMTAFGYSPSDQNSAYMMTDLRTDTEYISFGKGTQYCAIINTPCAATRTGPV